MSKFTSPEDIAIEIEGVSYLINTLADQISRNDGGLTANAREIAFYAIENYLLRISESIEQIGQSPAE